MERQKDRETDKNDIESETPSGDSSKTDDSPKSNEFYLIHNFFFFLLCFGNLGLKTQSGSNWEAGCSRGGFQELFIGPSLENPANKTSFARQSNPCRMLIRETSS